MTTIYLIRHGQASFGEKNYDNLSNKGEKQSQVLGLFLEKIIKKGPLIMSGSMKRHQQTAEISLKTCASMAEINIDSAWNEFNHQQIFERYDPKFADPSYLRQACVQADEPLEFLMQTFKQAAQRWSSNKYQDYDESWEEFQNRIEGALVNLCKKNFEKQNIIVYTSGGVISVLVSKLLGLSLEKTFELTWAVANTSITTLKLVDGKPKLLSFNEHCYTNSYDTELLTWI